VTRKVFVPGDEGFARFLEILENPSDEEVVATLRMSTNLGSDGATELVATTLPVQWPLGGLPLVFHAVTLDRQTLELSPPCVVIVP